MREVGAGPLERSPAGVDKRYAACAHASRHRGKRPRERKQVENIPVLRQSAREFSRVALIEIKPGLLAAYRVDLEVAIAFPDGQALGKGVPPKQPPLAANPLATRGHRIGAQQAARRTRSPFESRGDRSLRACMPADVSFTTRASP